MSELAAGSSVVSSDEALAGLGGTLMICLQGFRLGGAALSGISEQTTEHKSRFTLCKHL